MDEVRRNTERRKSERISQSFPVHASKDHQESLSQEQITGFTRDISGSGLSFISDGEYSVGDMLSLQIELFSSQHHFRVRVIHVESLGDSQNIGAVFLDMSPAHQKALVDELLQRKLD